MQYISVYHVYLYEKKRAADNLTVSEKKELLEKINHIGETQQLVSDVGLQLDILAGEVDVAHVHCHTHCEITLVSVLVTLVWVGVWIAPKLCRCTQRQRCQNH